MIAVLGALLGWLAGSVLRIRRAHVETAMRVAGFARPSREARAMYAALGTSAIEFLWLALRGARVLDRVHIDGASRGPWQRALGQGRGVVVAASHTGNWDLAACAIAREGPLLVVTKHLSLRWLDRFWQSTRARLGVRLTDARGAMAQSREALRGGGAVAMMIDQVPSSPRHAVAGEFLGQACAVDRAPAALAASTGAPLVVAAARREEGGAHVLQVLEVLRPPRRPSRAWIDEATRSATRALDRFVRAHPDQWLWMHRRWKRMDAARGHPSGARCMSAETRQRDEPGRPAHCS
jgi:KDO2-lipid IV(A) lauroyltransferase